MPYKNRKHILTIFVAELVQYVVTVDLVYMPYRFGKLNIEFDVMTTHKCLQMT